MKIAATLLLVFLSVPNLADGADRTILVTFENAGATKTAAAGTPYRFRKRYALSGSVRRAAKEISSEYGITEVDDWPIKSLSVYCFVYQVAENDDLEKILDLLNSDTRVESAQVMNRFEASTSVGVTYDDAYVSLQRGLEVLDVRSAHVYTRGGGVRIAVIDSHIDIDHEDLRGRVKSVKVYSDKQLSPDRRHGTAIASVIGASANNAKGIVGVAPESDLELLVSCWAIPESDNAVCDSFSLAKALDAVALNPPQVVNMSLTGPYDPLLHRLLVQVHSAGVVIVAAETKNAGDNNFPANVPEVIGVLSGDGPVEPGDGRIHAPAEQIMVAIPNGGYDFKSGSSIAAAHVSGVVALLLSLSPEVQQETVSDLLENSQGNSGHNGVSVDACLVLQLTNPKIICAARKTQASSLEEQFGT